MSKWITDRAPTEDDAFYYYILIWSRAWQKPYLLTVDEWNGMPWMPIPKPDPYVPFESEPPSKCSIWHEPRDFDKKYKWHISCNAVRVADNIPTREAAERIAAIYNEVME